MSEYLTPWSWEPLIYIQMVRTGGNLDFLLISEVESSLVGLSP